MMAGVAALERTTFRTIRLLEFYSRKELVAQTGHEPDAWPLVLLKELVDNGLDACEEAGIAPEIVVHVQPGAITVVDNGPDFVAWIEAKAGASWRRQDPAIPGYFDAGLPPKRCSAQRRVATAQHNPGGPTARSRSARAGGSRYARLGRLRGGRVQPWDEVVHRLAMQRFSSDEG